MPVVKSNGTVDGNTVTWDWSTVSGSTNTMFADTGMATVAVKGPFHKVGKAHVGRTVGVKAPVAKTKGAVRHYSWYVGSKLVKGATSNRLHLTAKQLHKVVSVKVTYTKAHYHPFVKVVRFGTIR